MAYNDKDLVSNSPGKEYDGQSKVRVRSIDELKRGDHIAFPRLWGAFWHHAIVEDVDTERREFQVIEYNNNDGKPGFLGITPIAEVVRKKFHEYRFQVDTVYRMIHGQCFDPETVVLRARSRLGEIKFNPFTNNSKHFALWCKRLDLRAERISQTKLNEAVGKRFTTSSFNVAGNTARAAIGQALIPVPVHRTEKDGGCTFYHNTLRT